MLIVNADDWGRTEPETEAALECYKLGRISSVTAMVFMADSVRASHVALEAGVDAGLHLNLNQHFTEKPPRQKLADYHQRIVRYLQRRKCSQLIYNPMLRNAFHYVYQSQIDEFQRLYGRNPSHIDGHQHMHLCMNMMLDRVIPAGQKVRRNFSFFPGEKPLLNRLYRAWIDRRLSRRYEVTDYFFSLSHYLAPDRMPRLIQLAANATVELMTHPAVPVEFDFLRGHLWASLLGSLRLANYSALGAGAAAYLPSQSVGPVARSN